MTHTSACEACGHAPATRDMRRTGTPFLCDECKEQPVPPGERRQPRGQSPLDDPTERLLRTLAARQLDYTRLRALIDKGELEVVMTDDGRPTIGEKL